MTSLQIFATLFGLIYIFFASKNKAICFLFGAISCSFWAYESFYNLNLKFDGILQLFYVLMSAYGAYNWYKGNQQKGTTIKRLTTGQNILYIVLGTVVSFACAKVALLYFDINYAYLDALTTGFAIIATILLAQRYFENWLYWMVINPVYVYIYFKSNAAIFAAMSCLYTVMAVWGWWNWKQEMKLAKEIS